MVRRRVAWCGVACGGGHSDVALAGMLALGPDRRRRRVASRQPRWCWRLPKWSKTSKTESRGLSMSSDMVRRYEAREDRALASAHVVRAMRVAGAASVWLWTKRTARGRPTPPRAGAPAEATVSTQQKSCPCWSHRAPCSSSSTGAVSVGSLGSVGGVGSVGSVGSVGGVGRDSVYQEVEPS